MSLGLSEIFILVLVLILFIRPEELPRFMYQCGQWYKKTRQITGQFNRQLHLLSQAPLSQDKTDAKKKDTDIVPTKDTMPIGKK